MFQVFSLDVAKVYLDVAYTCMLQAYIFTCFIHMLKVFYLDVAYILQWLHTCFQVFLGVCKCVFQTYVISVSAVSDICYKCFIWMLHMLQWNPPAAAVAATEAPPWVTMRA
jgi:hypothetical protein